MREEEKRKREIGRSLSRRILRVGSDALAERLIDVESLNPLESGWSLMREDLEKVSRTQR